METEKRLIDANVLMAHVKAIHKAVDTSAINTDYDTGFHSATSQIQGLISYMPTVDAVEVVSGLWIPVTERLPETDTCVLVRVNGNPHKNITLKGAYELAEYDPEGWFLEMWPEWMDAEVTHWMPLPEPPKEV